MHDEFSIRKRLACDQIAGGEQAQFGRQMCVGLHKHEPLGAALDDAVRDDPAVTHGPDDFANGHTQEQCIQQVFADLVEVDMLERRRDVAGRLFARICRTGIQRLDRPLIADQGQRAFLQAVENLAV